jgi:poly(A) polymerase
MAASGILSAVLPGAEPVALAPLVHLEAEAGLPPRWQRRLLALGWRPDWTDALRLSRADSRALAEAAAALATGDPPAAAAWRHGVDAARDAALVRAASLAVAPPPGLEADLARGAAARFPVAAADLDRQGPALGRAQKRLDAAWLASDFTLSAADLAALDRTAGD